MSEIYDLHARRCTLNSNLKRTYQLWIHALSVAAREVEALKMRTVTLMFSIYQQSVNLADTPNRNKGNRGYHTDEIVAAWCKQMRIFSSWEHHQTALMNWPAGKVLFCKTSDPIQPIYRSNSHIYVFTDSARWVTLRIVRQKWNINAETKNWKQHKTRALFCILIWSLVKPLCFNIIKGNM